METLAFVRWSEDALRMPYRSVADGVGPGEERFAREVNGRVMGGTKPYDVEFFGYLGWWSLPELNARLCGALELEHQRWEIKAPDSSKWTGKVRIEKKGVEAIKPALKHVESAVELLMKLGWNSPLLELVKNEVVLDRLSLSRIVDFVENDAKDLLRGELSVGRMEKFHEALWIVHEALRFAKNDGRYTLGSFKVTQNDYVRLAADRDVFDFAIGIDPIDYVGALFEHDAFVDPDGFMERHWKNAVRPSDAFGEVTGLALVNEEGYVPIHKEELNSVLEFRNVSKGNPYLGLRRDVKVR